jgi:hypothetical protein
MSESNIQNTQGWWNPTMGELAKQLSKGILNEMKKRILTSNIKKEKLQLNEQSDRMKDFFQRKLRDIRNENRRYQTNNK